MPRSFSSRAGFHFFSCFGVGRAGLDGSFGDARPNECAGISGSAARHVPGRQLPCPFCARPLSALFWAQPKFRASHNLSVSYCVSFWEYARPALHALTQKLPHRGSYENALMGAENPNRLHRRHTGEIRRDRHDSRRRHVRGRSPTRRPIWKSPTSESLQSRGSRTGKIGPRVDGSRWISRGPLSIASRPGMGNALGPTPVFRMD